MINYDCKEVLPRPCRSCWMLTTVPDTKHSTPNSMMTMSLLNIIQKYLRSFLSGQKVIISRRGGKIRANADDAIDPIRDMSRFRKFPNIAATATVENIINIKKLQC